MTATAKISVLIVDDSPVMRQLFSRLLSTIADIEVLDTAVDAMDAREKIKRLNPDVLTLDVEMPGMDGLSFLEKIMTLRPMPVIMLSTLTHRGTEESIRALEIGAVDCLGKPTNMRDEESLCRFAELLALKIRIAARAKARHYRRVIPSTQQLVFHQRSEGHVLAIGSSTGGVEALRDIFRVLPANSPPIVMTQHMPPLFTTSLAARLDSLSAVAVAEAYDGAKLESGKAWLAPGGKHLRVIREGRELRCQLNDAPLVSGHKPSVDVLFCSVSEVVGEKAIAAILTGMGRDGAEGMLEIRQRGGYTIGQSEPSCVVYGMPKAAAQLGALEVQLPLHEIAAHMLHACSLEKVV